jgi:hypothetical protein
MCDIVFEFGKAPTTGADLGTNMGAFTALAERVVGDTGRLIGIELECVEWVYCRWTSTSMQKWTGTEY